jgi:hypothetical protein
VAAGVAQSTDHVDDPWRAGRDKTQLNRADVLSQQRSGPP